MSNTPSKDLFNDFEIPAFETGTNVPVPPSGAVAVPSVSSEIPYITIIAGIAAIMMFILLIKLFKKERKERNFEEQEEDFIEEETVAVEKTINKPATQAIEIKSKKEKRNFSTPTNINKCIRLFLENTRTK